MTLNGISEVCDIDGVGSVLSGWFHEACVSECPYIPLSANDDKHCGTEAGSHVFCCMRRPICIHALVPSDDIHFGDANVDRA